VCFLYVRTSSAYRKVKLSPYQVEEACVSCEVRISSTYKKVKLSLYQAVEVYTCVCCEVRTSSTHNKVKFPCNIPWRPTVLRDVETPTFSSQSVQRWR
jgi:hypothetical protein